MLQVIIAHKRIKIEEIVSFHVLLMIFLMLQGYAFISFFELLGRELEIFTILVVKYLGSSFPFSQLEFQLGLQTELSRDMIYEKVHDNKHVVAALYMDGIASKRPRRFIRKPSAKTTSGMTENSQWEIKTAAAFLALLWGG